MPRTLRPMTRRTLFTRMMVRGARRMQQGKSRDEIAQELLPIFGPYFRIYTVRAMELFLFWKRGGPDFARKLVGKSPEETREEIRRWLAASQTRAAPHITPRSSPIVRVGSKLYVAAVNLRKRKRRQAIKHQKTLERDRWVETYARREVRPFQSQIKALVADTHAAHGKNYATLRSSRSKKELERLFNEVLAKLSRPEQIVYDARYGKDIPEKYVGYIVPFNQPYTTSVLARIQQKFAELIERL